MIGIDISEIKKNPGEVIHREITADLPAIETGEPGRAGEITIPGQARLNLTITNNGKVFSVEGIVRAGLKLACGRCLESYVQDIEAPLREVYCQEDVYDSVKENHEECIPFKGDVINITPEALKAVILEIPMKALCNKGCKGLCPGCGQNQNIKNCGCQKETVDPRLAVLKDLVPREKQ